MSDYSYIIKKLREDTLSDEQIFSKIRTRFFPSKVSLGADGLEYPLIAFSFMSGFPDRDNYPSTTHLIEVYFVSEKSIDEAIGLYERWVSIMDKKRYRDDTDKFSFEIFQDSVGIDATDMYDGKLFYVFSNTMAVRTVG